MEQVEGIHIIVFVKFCKQDCASPWERNCKRKEGRENKLESPARNKLASI